MVPSLLLLLLLVTLGNSHHLTTKNCTEEEMKEGLKCRIVGGQAAMEGMLGYQVALLSKYSVIWVTRLYV